MSKPLKYSLLAVGGLMGVLVLAALILLPILGANSRKLAQTFASEALGMKVGIDDRPGISFYPRLHLALENVRIRNRGAEVASAAQAILAKLPGGHCNMFYAGSVAAPASSTP